ncbi:UNVERIFIED_CONTAM: hypothetical protein FKN15_055499 [Acipenser sinensis]
MASKHVDLAIADKVRILEALREPVRVAEKFGISKSVVSRIFKLATKLHAKLRARWRIVLDDKNVRRRFRASNYQSTTRVKPFICTMPMRLDDGWNQIQFNLSDFTRRAYGTNYIETLRVQIHANCRIRRVYFSDRLYSEDELPAEFKLYLPVQNKVKS